MLWKLADNVKYEEDCEVRGCGEGTGVSCVGLRRPPGRAARPARCQPGQLSLPEEPAVRFLFFLLRCRLLLSYFLHFHLFIFLYFRFFIFLYIYIFFFLYGVFGTLEFNAPQLAEASQHPAWSSAVRERGPRSRGAVGALRAGRDARGPQVPG